MKDKIMILFISVILLSGCGFEKLAEWDISELYAQKIEGTSKILYKYDAWGGRDSHVSGFIILDSTQTFKIDLKNTLPFYNLSAIPNRSKIEGIKHECYNSCGEEYHNATPIFSPIKIENSDSEGIGLITKIYQNRGLSERDRGLRGDFIFEKFIETRDSIYFFNLNEVKYVDNKHLDELKLKKGEVYLTKNENDEIISIVINQTTINPANNEIIEAGTYFLSPENKISISAFSNRGIFKQVIAPR